MSAEADELRAALRSALRALRKLARDQARVRRELDRLRDDVRREFDRLQALVLGCKGGGGPRPGGA